jgi:hypothetical protein
LKGDGEDLAIDSEDAASGSLFHPEDVRSNIKEDRVPGIHGQTQLAMPSLCDPNISPIYSAPAAPARQTSPRCKDALAAAEESANQSTWTDTVTDAGTLPMTGVAGTLSVRGRFIALPPLPLTTR